MAMVSNRGIWRAQVLQEPGPEGGSGCALVYGDSTLRAGRSQSATQCGTEELREETLKQKSFRNWQKS